MNIGAKIRPSALDPAKFRDPSWTASGQKRATITLRELRTLWFNTGTLCNLTCRNCYIESSPRNDRLVYLSAEEVCAYLDEVRNLALPTLTIGFTGGEPFLNNDITRMLEAALERSFGVLVLTNAMKPMRRHSVALLALRERFGQRLILRVSLDHYTAALHETERGHGSWAPTIAGLRWLDDNRFRIAVAGRNFAGETEAALRDGYARLFATEQIRVDAYDPGTLILFPEMDRESDVAEITEACWGILGRSPDAVMCATSRMIAKRKGADAPVVLACTLLPYDEMFELGSSLDQASHTVALNHPFCAQFCVLGGASCRAE